MLVFMLLSSLVSLAAAAPQVQLGNTTLVGRDVPLLKQDFFGGKATIGRLVAVVDTG